MHVAKIKQHTFVGVLLKYVFAKNVQFNRGYFAKINIGNKCSS